MQTDNEQPPLGYQAFSLTEGIPSLAQWEMTFVSYQSPHYHLGGKADTAGLSPHLLSNT